MIEWIEFDKNDHNLECKNYLVYQDYGDGNYEIAAGTWMKHLGCFLDRCDDDIFFNVTHYAELNVPNDELRPKAIESIEILNEVSSE